MISILRVKYCFQHLFQIETRRKNGKNFTPAEISNYLLKLSIDFLFFLSIIIHRYAKRLQLY